MAQNEIHKNDVGTVIQATVQDGSAVVDISAATSTFVFKKPSGSVVSQSGVLVTDGTDGKVKYTTESGFLDTIGTWHFQVKVVSGANMWYSDVHNFKVHRNVE
jgi:hypothetical protein